MRFNESASYRAYRRKRNAVGMNVFQSRREHSAAHRNLNRADNFGRNALLVSRHEIFGFELHSDGCRSRALRHDNAVCVNRKNVFVARLPSDVFKIHVDGVCTRFKADYFVRRDVDARRFAEFHVFINDVSRPCDVAFNFKAAPVGFAAVVGFRDNVERARPVYGNVAVIVNGCNIAFVLGIVRYRVFNAPMDFFIRCFFGKDQRGKLILHAGAVKIQRNAVNVLIKIGVNDCNARNRNIGRDQNHVCNKNNSRNDCHRNYQ